MSGWYFGEKKHENRALVKIKHNKPQREVDFFKKGNDELVVKNVVISKVKEKNG
jgi:hypothetical protein